MVIYHCPVQLGDPLHVATVILPEVPGVLQYTVDVLLVPLASLALLVVFLLLLQFLSNPVQRRIIAYYFICIRPFIHEMKFS